MGQQPQNFHFKRAFETLSHVQVKRDQTSKSESCNENLSSSSFCDIWKQPYLQFGKYDSQTFREIERFLVKIKIHVVESYNLHTLISVIEVFFSHAA